MKPLKGDQQLRCVSLSYSGALQALKPKSSPRKKKGPGCKHRSRSHGESGEVFSLDILSHRMSVMAMFHQSSLAGPVGSGNRERASRIPDCMGHNVEVPFTLAHGAAA